MRFETVSSDITVIGGGLAGVCAAVAAARLGQTVSLVQNRPVLGGNSSSEVRVWVCGATSHGVHRNARETGIMGELFIENQYRNIDGNPYIWDVIVLEKVKAERNITLFLNTDVHEVEASGNEDNRWITSVIGWMMGSERRIRFESKIYLDCTGDGLVGFLAGAKHRLGREAQEEFNEDWAPLVPDDITLGSTLLFYTKDAGRSVKYIAPSFAKDITKTSIPMNRVIRSGDNGCAYWWIEWGGELDTVHDNEQIRDELSSVIYGIWDYIKNSGKFDADNLTLEWIGSVPGKREYRRFVGDYVLNQNDIIAQETFEDRVAFGGWSIDLHPPQGMYATAEGSKHLHMDGSYHIPFRSLYSMNVQNMLMAGRNISASHVAFGTTRVMATCAVIGEAAGTGAALCVQKGVSPRMLQAKYLGELQQTLLRQDASVLGLKNTDAADLALRAKLTASSTLTRLVREESIGTMPLDTDLGFIVPAEPGIDGIELLVDAAHDTELTVELWSTGKPQNYVPHTLEGACKIVVSAGEKQWARASLSWHPKIAQNAFIIVKQNADASLHLSDRPLSGVLSFKHTTNEQSFKDSGDMYHHQPVVEWSGHSFVRKPFCFRLCSPTLALAADKATDGYTRPYGGPHMWSSQAMEPGTPEWLELSWQEPLQIRCVHITFNDDVNEDLINLHHHRTTFEVIPELAKDYQVQAWVKGEWITVAKESGNHTRKKIHKLEAPIRTEKLRIVISSTNGSMRAEIVEVRCYE
ncbi:pyridine nucleotide-disulfide oxidoreductase [Paenibacillus selenitireducens]|uniref:Pyridine nucleotide-disulfide oxidoreductase n=1 Tax=Paenibacillus selenitireducens TaxID=1324314 RepID=A0A1T2X5F0_9BACL|nr:FAD-dependent oxidoreductase [Paenibacillus selenitireducens]OPA75104.1 pyridine nucleotide-disulfide oxidoreductase [Paenibacillus selenitireducens]